MSALRSATHFATSTGIKVLSGLVAIKLIASEVGPEGFGLLGQLMTVVAITTMLAGGGITNGVIKSLANASTDTAEGKEWLSTAFTLSTKVSLAIAIACITLAHPLASSLLKGNAFYLFFILAAAQAIVAYGNLILAEASSRGDSAFYAKTHIIGTLSATCALVFLIKAFGFEGAAAGLILMPALPGLIALYHSLRKRPDLIGSFYWNPNRQRSRHLLSFSTATVIGALSVPLAHLVIREYHSSQFGWNTVGHWQGIVKISDVYMQFVGVVLINYAIPRFAAAPTIDRALAELGKTMSLLLSLMTVGLALLYTLRNWAIPLVFSESFLPMSDLLPAQLAGDILRTAAASISFFFMARGYLTLSIGYEFLQGPVLIAVFFLLQDAAGIYAPVYAHLVSNLLLTATMAATLKIWTWSRPQ